MSDEDLKNRLAALSEVIGVSKLCVELHAEGLSPRQAEKLAMGDHKGAFRRRTVAAVRAVLAKNGRLAS